MPRIVDYCTAPIQKRRVSITDEMADEVREILGRAMTADDVAREFDNDSEVQEVVREMIAEDVEEEPYPGWAAGMGISEKDWADHYESVDMAMRVQRKFAARRAALAAEYAKKMEKLEQQERKMMPLWSPKSKLIRELNGLIYRGLDKDEISRLDKAMDELKLLVKKSPAAPSMSPAEKANVSLVEVVEST